RGDPPPGFVDLVPAFVSIVVHYDPSAAARRGAATPQERVVSLLRQRAASLEVEELGAPRVVEIPVCYGGDLGPDLDDVARTHGLTAEERMYVSSGCGYL